MFIRARQAVAAVALAISALGVSAAAARAQELQEAMPVSLNPPVVADAMENRGDGIWWEGRVVGPPDSLYLRLSFSDIRRRGSGDFQVVIRSANERFLTSYRSEAFRDGEDFYSDVLYASSVKVQIQGRGATGSPKGLHFVIDSLLSAVDVRGHLTPQSILPTWRSLDQVSTSPMHPFVEAIAKLYMGDGAVCTGFLIGPALLLTNHHCLAHSTEFRVSPPATPRCGDIKVHFDYINQARPDQFSSASCQGVAKSSSTLDFAVLKLGAESAKRSSSRKILLLATADATTGAVYIVHHPAGLPTQVSLDCGLFAGTTPAIIQHDCSTTGGSSGAPVLTRDGTVVALHSDGAYPDNITIRELNERIAKHEVFLNKARPAGSIRTEIKDLLPVISSPPK